MASTPYFQIKNKDLLKVALTKKPDEKPGRIITHHVEEFEKHFKNEKLIVNNTINYHNDIFNKKNRFTDRAFNAFICCLFDGNITEETLPEERHTIKDIKKFYKAIKVPRERMDNETRDKYNRIIKILVNERPYLAEYNLKMNNRWNILPSSTTQLRNIISEKRTQYLKYLLAIIVFIITLFFFQKAINIFTELSEKRNIIEHAKITKASRTSQLISLYDEINDELKNDYQKDGLRNLSQELIGRIITISEEMKPYLYLKDNTLIENALSPERANLFTTLFKSKLDHQTFEYIIGEANFMYSDFSGYDLSGLKLSNSLYGIKRKENYSIFSFIITPAKRGRFNYSNFKNVNLKKARLFGDFSFCDFRGALLEETFFYWSELQGSNFQNNTFVKSRFDNSNVRHSNFKNTHFTKVESGFYSCDLRGSIFDYSTFSHIPFSPFENCFFGSKGTYFTYDIQIGRPGVSLYGSPFIIDTTLTNKNISATQHFNTLNITHPIDDWSEKDTLEYKLDSTLIFTGSNKQKEKLFSALNNFEFEENHKSPLQSYIVKTDDNYSIDGHYYCYDFQSKYLLLDFQEEKNIDSIFYERFPIIKIKNDRIEVYYSNETITYEQNKNISENGIASFIGCMFKGTSFKDSSMKYVSFKDSEFYVGGNFDPNGFNNVRLMGNDFRIKKGVIKFDKKTVYDSLITSDKHPIQFLPY